MQFLHRGRQFFFITLALERGMDGGATPEPPPREALSRLVDEKSRPALLPCGEVVKAVLLALHGAFPCATVSDFVIMPDHVHFLLIVDYSQNPAFSPLWASHRLMDATEILWALRGERTGALPPNPQKEATPAATIAQQAAAALGKAIEMARRNQGHLIVGNQAVLPHQGLEGAAAHNSHAPQGGRGAQPARAIPMQGVRGAQPARAIPMQGVRGAQPPVPSPIAAPRWNRRCYIELSFDARQLKAIRRYIRLNPARALWKARHPDRFIRFANIRHAVLDPARRWDAMGNLTLLGSPFLYHVRLTMRKTAEEHAPEIAAIMARTRRGLVPVSGFISHGEKELLRQLKAEPLARFIKTVPFALPPRYDPSAEDSRELAADRLLILSGFPQGTPDSRENLRARCNIMNDLAAALCARAAEIK